MKNFSDIYAAEKHSHKSAGKASSHKHTEHKKHHEKKEKKDFKYPLMSTEELVKNVKAGYTFRVAKKSDLGDKTLSFVTVKLPTAGYLPVVKIDPKPSDSSVSVPKDKLAKA